jgi:hypothetical protein
MRRVTEATFPLDVSAPSMRWELIYESRFINARVNPRGKIRSVPLNSGGIDNQIYREISIAPRVNSPND